MGTALQEKDILSPGISKITPVLEVRWKLAAIERETPEL